MDFSGLVGADRKGVQTGVIPVVLVGIGVLRTEGMAGLLANGGTDCSRTQRTIVDFRLEISPKVL